MAFADSQSGVSTGIPSIRVDVALVQVPVNVTDALGNPVPNLGRDNFRLFEDGTEQPIRYFSASDAPVSVGIVVDASGSMEGKLREAREAVAALLRTSVPGDEFLLVSFSDRVRIVSEFVGDPDVIARKLPRIRTGGWTALLDAIDLGLSAMKRARNDRRVLLVVSDGEDNRSRFTETEVRKHIRESGTCVYATALYGDDQSEHNIRLLSELAGETGGLAIRVASLAELTAAIRQISVNIRNQYLLGYTPAAPSDGRYRKVTVEVTGAAANRYRASWRTGYYSPLPEPAR